MMKNINRLLASLQLMIVMYSSVAEASLSVVALGRRPVRRLAAAASMLGIARLAVGLQSCMLVLVGFVACSAGS